MSAAVRALLARARRELDAARVLAEAGFAEQAISRTYYGTFYSAEAALLSLGETRSKHSGVVAVFGRLVVKEGGLDVSVGSELRRLFELRNAVDYSWLEADARTAGDALTSGARFVATVERWIEASGGSAR